MPEESTTPDLEEALRRGVEALNRREFDAAVAVTFSRDGVWDMSVLGVGVFTGHEAIRGFFEDWFGAYEHLEVQLDEYNDLGRDVTFGVHLQRGTPRAASGSVEFRYATVYTWRDGLIARATTYTDIDEARAAAERLAQERG